MLVKRSFRMLVCLLTVVISFASFVYLLPHSQSPVLAATEEESFWRSLSTDYYYDQLTGREKELYEKFDRACMETLLSTRTYSYILIDGLEDLHFTRNDAEIVNGIYYLFRGSNPQYFFMDGKVFFYSSEGYLRRINITLHNGDDYDFQNSPDREQVKSDIRAMISEYDSIIPSNARPETVERLVHDKMCDDIDYDYFFSNAIQNGQTIVSAVNGLTVCNGYSMMFEALMNHYGIQCLYVSSIPHAWNIINLHGYWYYVDVTNDDQDGNGILSLFYNCSSGQFDPDDEDYIIEYPFNDLAPQVIYDDLDQNRDGSVYRYYSDRYFSTDGYTYFIVNDIDDAYGYLALPLYESSSIPSQLTYNNRTYNIIGATHSDPDPDTPSLADICRGISWSNTSDGSNHYDNTEGIQLDAYFDNGTDYSGVFYQVVYNGSLIYTSERGQLCGYYNIRIPGAPTTDSDGNTYLAAGSYKISFYDGNGDLIGEDTAIVTAPSAATSNEIVSEPSGGTTPAAEISASEGIPSDSGTAPSPDTSSENVASDSVVPTPVTETGVAGFVERLYTVALGRASDPAGKQDWIDAITMRGNTGADAARGFLYSPEFLNKALSNEDFTRILYITFFNREPDQAGFEAWVNALNNGASKQDVIEGFINSTEWANLCLRYGIASGGTGAPNIEIEPSQGTIDFCTRLYTTCLGRNADQSGLMAWARQLANQRDSGTGAARGFFFSTEFTNQNVSNGEYVTRLYRTFMGREPDEAGYNAWVGQLDSGVSREEVFSGFALSAEFTRICASYGIIR